MAGAGPFTPPEALLGELLARAAGGRIIAAIAGPPGSGKSHLVDRLRAAAEAQQPGVAAVLPMDGYHYDDLVLVPRGWRARKGAPHTFDVAGLRAMLARLRAHDVDEIAVPLFDREIEIARAGAAMIPRKAALILVEGNYLLLDRPPWSSLAPLFDVTVMLVAPEAVLRERLTARWVAHRLAPERLHDQIEHNDMANGMTVTRDSRAADYRVDATLQW